MTDMQPLQTTTPYADLVEDLSVARSQLDVVRNELITVKSELDVKKGVILDMTDDWQQLNQLINDYAEDAGMCDDYEKKLAKWNEQFHDLKLVGRYKEHTVNVKVTITYCNEITVQARDADHADDLARNLDLDELMTGLDRDYDQDDFDFTIGQINEVKS